MKTTTLTLLAAAIAFGACQNASADPEAVPAPEVAEALDMAAETETEWGAAPWSPPGWPLKVGDKISRETFDELDKRFPGWLNGLAVNWVDDLPFGALILLGDSRDVKSSTPWVYHGHFPRKVRPIFKSVLSNGLPPHLRGRNLDHLLKSSGQDRIIGIAARRDGSYAIEDARELWHEPWLRKYAGGKGGGL